MNSGFSLRAVNSRAFALALLVFAIGRSSPSLVVITVGLTIGKYRMPAWTRQCSNSTGPLVPCEMSFTRTQVAKASSLSWWLGTQSCRVPFAFALNSCYSPLINPWTGGSFDWSSITWSTHTCFTFLLFPSLGPSPLMVTLVSTHFIWPRFTSLDLESPYTLAWRTW